MLAPQLAPLLQGKLTPNSFSGEVCLRDLSNLTGGLRFRYMEIREVDGASPPLKTCGDTFEILRIYPTDHSGTGRSLSILKGPRLPDLHSGGFLYAIPFVLLAPHGSAVHNHIARTLWCRHFIQGQGRPRIGCRGLI